MRKLLQDDKFIATGAGNQVAPPDASLEPLPNRPEQVVANIMAECVIDFLEPVEVQTEGRHAIVSAVLFGELRQPLSELRPIGKAGQ